MDYLYTVKKRVFKLPTFNSPLTEQTGLQKFSSGVGTVLNFGYYFLLLVGGGVLFLFWFFLRLSKCSFTRNPSSNSYPNLS